MKVLRKQKKWFHELKFNDDVQIYLLGSRKIQRNAIVKQQVQRFAKLKKIQYFETDLDDEKQAKFILQSLVQNILLNQNKSLKSVMGRQRRRFFYK
jgi:hypothetical protein